MFVCSKLLQLSYFHVANRDFPQTRGKVLILSHPALQPHFPFCFPKLRRKLWLHHPDPCPVQGRLLLPALLPWEKPRKIPTSKTSIGIAFRHCHLRNHASLILTTHTNTRGQLTAELRSPSSAASSRPSIALNTSYTRSQCRPHLELTYVYPFARRT